MQAARDGRTFSYVVVERVEGKYVFRREYRNLVAVSYHTGGETDEMEFGIAGDE